MQCRCDAETTGILTSKFVPRFFSLVVQLKMIGSVVVSTCLLKGADGLDNQCYVSASEE